MKILDKWKISLSQGKKSSVIQRVECNHWRSLWTLQPKSMSSQADEASNQISTPRRIQPQCLSQVTSGSTRTSGLVNWRGSTYWNNTQAQINTESQLFSNLEAKRTQIWGIWRTAKMIWWTSTSRGSFLSCCTSKWMMRGMRATSTTWIRAIITRHNTTTGVLKQNQDQSVQSLRMLRADCISPPWVRKEIWRSGLSRPPRKSTSQRIIWRARAQPA